MTASSGSHKFEEEEDLSGEILEAEESEDELLYEWVNSKVLFTLANSTFDYYISIYLPVIYLAS